MESAVQSYLHESYHNWMAGDADKEYTAGGNMGAPARRILEARVLKAWNMLDTERVKNSLKVCVCVCVTLFEPAREFNVVISCYVFLTNRSSRPTWAVYSGGGAQLLPSRQNRIGCDVDRLYVLHVLSE